ncbi:MAG: FtsQ-type POTRA domain-containing protein [Patescibacteria group bacterium]|nr:FtsQ-type POTRA domain-containing protein [Patescibacteria group bacterium]
MIKDFKVAKHFKKHRLLDHSRRVGRYKNPLFAQRADQILKLRKVKKRIIIVAVIVAVCALFYFFIIGPYFYISKVSVEGINTIKGQELQKLVEEFLNTRRYLVLPNQNILFMDTGRLRREIGENYVLDDLKIKRKLPNELILQIQERASDSILSIGGNYYYLDSRGIILRRLSEAEIYPGLSAGPFSGDLPEFKNIIDERTLPLIYVLTPGDVQIGQQFMNFECYDKILGSQYILTMNTPYTIKYFKINDLNVRWFKLVTVDGWEIHLDLDKNLQTQIVKVYTFIKEEKLNPSDYQYFNARYEDKIYYK